MTLARTPYARLSPADIGQVDRELKKLEQMSAGLYVPKTLVAARSPYTVQGTDTMLLCDCTAGAITLTFPLAARVEGMSVVVVKSDSSANAVTLTGTFSGAVDPRITVAHASYTVSAMNGVYHVTAGVTYPVPSGETGVTNLLYSYGDVRRYGVDPANSAATNATAIANASLAAAALGVMLYFPPGVTYNTNGNLVITGACMGAGCTLNWSGTGDAIAVGASYSGSGGIPFVQNLPIYLPLVANANKTVNGWAQAGVAGSVGVRVRHLYNSRQLTVPWVRNFESGIVMYGEHDGCDYNEIHIGHLSNNKRNLVLDATTDGWTNENQFVSGRLAHDSGEGTLVTGVRQLLILGNVGGVVDVLNNHKFRGLAFEGDVPEFEVETHGSDSLWDHCRWERSTGNAKFLSSGNKAIANTVRGGYNSHLITFTTAGGAFQPRLEHRDGLAISGASAGAVLELANQNSSASPIIRAYNAGQDLLGAGSDTNWVWQLWAQGLQGKQSTDGVGQKRLFLDPVLGTGLFSKILSSIMDSGGGQASVADGGGTTTLMTGFGVGLVLVADTNTGKSALIWIGTNSSILNGATTDFSLVSGTATHYNVYVSGGNLIFENRRGAGTASVPALVLRLA